MLRSGDLNGYQALARRRRRAFASKWRFNRLVRRLVDSPAALRIGAVTASVAPGLLRSLVDIAGDCAERHESGRP
jgi:hypothetical protein